MRGRTLAVGVQRVDGQGAAATIDEVAVEEALEIRLGYARRGTRAVRSLSVTMRTPGDDAALAAGFLFAEGLVRRAEEIAEIVDSGAARDVVRVELADGVKVDLGRSGRSFLSSSSCGVCGKESLESLRVDGEPVGAGPVVDDHVVHALPGRLREAQAVFGRTGGLHAAGLFEPDGALVSAAEDVGRHNAVDKVVGERFLAGDTPLSGLLLMVSGRTSFEILQKAVAGGLPIVVAVGAPSSAAVALARRFGLTLIGFARDGRFNVYTGAERVRCRTAGG